MNVYRWYTEALCVGGITCAKHKEDATKQAEDYIRRIFSWNKDELYGKGYMDLELQVWPIEEDAAYCKQHPMTIATHY